MYTGSMNNSPKESDCLLGSEKFDEEIDENWSSLMENSIWKQSHWSLIRFLLMTGFLSLIILVCTLGGFIFIQPYPSYMQWYPVGEDTRSLFLNLTTPRYFHNVEIFLEDISNHSETEWLHLLSLQQIIRLQYLQANESVGLASYIHSGKKYITFKQTIHYSNKTEEKWKSCWQAVKHDLYEESICHSSKNHSITLIKGFKIYFSYILPRKQQHLGNVLYNATKIISNGHKLREQAHVKLKYFQNTITHVSSKKPKSLQCDHNLDKWSSGPFRSYNLQANDKQYIKYRSIDLVPIKNLWKTGIANCQSTAPIGPQICNCPVL